MTQIIYRFEYPDGEGIYWHDDPEKRVGTFFEFDNRHPHPENDSLLGVITFSPDYYFGFLSIEQLRSWFYKDEFLVKLHEKGILISEYNCECCDVLEGHTQAMFIRGKSLDRMQYNILEYFELEVV